MRPFPVIQTAGALPRPVYELTNVSKYYRGGGIVAAKLVELVRIFRRLGRRWRRPRRRRVVGTALSADVSHTT